MMKIFNTASWPSTFLGTKESRTWGNGEIATLATYYEKNQYNTSKEKQQWPLFRHRVLQRKQGKKDIKLYQEILKENSGDVKGMTVLLIIMMAFREAQLPQNENYLGGTQGKQILVHELQKNWGSMNRNGRRSRYKEHKTKQRNVKLKRANLPIKRGKKQRQKKGKTSM